MLFLSKKYGNNFGKLFLFDVSFSKRNHEMLKFVSHANLVKLN